MSPAIAKCSWEAKLTPRDAALVGGLGVSSVSSLLDDVYCREGSWILQLYDRDPGWTGNEWVMPPGPAGH